MSISKPVALQLYSVRELCAKNFPATLKKVAEIGYQGVEFAGLHNRPAGEIAKVVKDLGLSVCSSHTALPTKENVNQLVDQELTLGSRKIIAGLGPDAFETPDMCRKTADIFARAAELLKKPGLTLGYHNHWWEMKLLNKEIAYEITLKQSSAFFAQADVYWVQFGGVDAAEFVSRWKKRIPLLHIKDGDLEQNHPHLPVGSGKMNIPKIVNSADPDTLEWLIVELDTSDMDMMEAVKQSYNYLNNFLRSSRHPA